MPQATHSQANGKAKTSNCTTQATDIQTYSPNEKANSHNEKTSSTK